MLRSSVSSLAAVAVTALAFAVAPAAAQTVLVRAVSEDGGQPVVGAVAHLVAADGGTTHSALTDDLGRALFVGVGTGPWRVRVEMIGRATGETEAFTVEPAGTAVHDVRLASSAILLEGIDVAADERCEIRGGDEGLLVADVWDEARKALEAASITEARGTNRYETVRYDRQIDAYTDEVLVEERERYDGYMRTPFESRPAVELVQNGFVQDDAGDDIYYAPDAAALLSDAFLDTHCFRLSGERNAEGLLGLEFEPTDDRDVPDIRGVMWLDPATAELSWLEFRYTGLVFEKRSPRVGGRVDFRKLPDGRWIIPEWWIRMPIIGVQEDLDGRQDRKIIRFHQTGGLVTDVHETGGRTLGRMANTGGIEGVVRDSVGVPLRGVRVGVVGSNQEVFSNDRGQFSITGLTEGTYRVRFVDQRLEIMGYVPDPLVRDVIRGEMTWVEYMTPSVGDVLFEACRDEAVDNGYTRLVGIVVGEDGAGVEGAVVTVGWSGFRTPEGLLIEDRTAAEATTSATGFFRFCGVPANTRLTLEAVVGERGSEEQILRIPDWETGRAVVLELISGTGSGRVPYK